MVLSRRDVKHPGRFVDAQSPIWPHPGRKEAAEPEFRDGRFLSFFWLVRVLTT